MSYFSGTMREPTVRPNKMTSTPPFARLPWISIYTFSKRVGTRPGTYPFDALLVLRLERLKGPDVDSDGPLVDLLPVLVQQIDQSMRGREVALVVLGPSREEERS